MSEKQELYANQLLEGEEVTEFAQVSDPEILMAIKEESLIKLGYFLNPSELFSFIVARGNGKFVKNRKGIFDYDSVDEFVESGALTEKRGSEENTYILDRLQEVLNHIEQSTMGSESEEDFAALFEDLDLTSTKLGRTVGARNEIIVQILTRIDEIDFKLEEIESDVLGDAYEYLIGKFAKEAGKSKGEFYTPQEVSTIIAKIVATGKTKIKSVYDPTCGSGSLLLRVAKEADVSEFYGQELNRTTYNLARMNMILHDVHYRQFDIRQENTLEEPQHLEYRFEAIVANPPFSAHWKGNKNPLNSTDERFSQFGKLAPNTKADYAFVTHMYFQLADNGTMACVLPHGVLYRGAAEHVIRKYFIEELNALDAVIGLPANIFYGTSIPTCILVLKKCREADENIVFIDASGEDHFEKVKNQNELREQDVLNIVETYRNRTAKDKYSSIVTLQEVRDNDYNLNMPRYVDTFEDEVIVDLDAVTERLRAIDEDLAEVDEEITTFCVELNIATPF